MDPRELAYQIIDIIHLRPEIELCYMGLASKCFEVLENRPRDYDLRGEETASSPSPSEGGFAPGYGNGGAQEGMSDEESEGTEEEEEESVGWSEGESESEGGEEQGHGLRVREILFYEERVEAFRRRHGVLRP